MPFNVGGQILNSAQLKYYNDTGIVRNGLIFYVDGGLISSYPGSGTTWTDISGYGNNGTLTNGPSYSTSGGGSISCDGTDDYIVVSSNSIFNFGTGNFTIDVWIYPQSFSNYTHMFAMPDQNTFGLKANVNDGVIYFYSSAFTTYGNTPGWTLTLNAWNHVVLTRSSNVAYAYLNGVSKGSVAGFNNNITNNTVYIHYGHPSEFVPDLFQSVKVYNRALSAQEVLQNYQALKQRVNPDLVGTQANPAVSATQMYNLGYRTNGTYWLKPPASATAFQAYVDFTTTGGPWVHIGSVVDDGSTSNTAYHVWGAPFNPPQDTGIWQDSSTYGTLSLTTNFKSLGWSTISFTQLLIKDQGSTQRNLLYTNSGQVSAGSFSSWIGSLSWAALGSDTSNAAVAGGRVTNLAITNFGVNDDVLQSSGKSRMLFKWGEYDGAQDGNKDRVMIAWDRSDAADTVDAPTGLGCFTNRGGTIDYRNITPGAYYGNTADFPPASITGAPYYYTLWVKN